MVTMPIGKQSSRRCSYNMIINSRCASLRVVPRLKGFSLIEVLVSLTILAMSMMALMSMQTAALRSSSNNQNILMAQQVAAQAIEWVRTLTDDALTQSPVSVFPVLGENLAESLDSEFRFNTLTSTLPVPTGFGTPTFKRFVGYRIRAIQDGNVDHVDKLFVVRVLVKKKYRSEQVGGTEMSVMSKCAVTVYWMQDGVLQSLDVGFFVDRKA